MIGDSDDMLARARSLIPRGWLPDASPVADALLFGFASVASHAHALLGFARNQARIATASDGFLDLIAYDFFGLRIKRRSGQTDESFRALILREIFRERVTRAGIQQAVRDLVGFEVRAFEPFNATDCGGLDTAYLGFDMLGRFGAVDMPRQIFIATLQPVGAGIPNAGGFDDGLGGLDNAVGGQNIGFGSDELGDQSQVIGPVTDQDIYDTVNATRAAGVTAWVAIGLPPEAHLDTEFTLDQSELVGPPA